MKMARLSALLLALLLATPAWGQESERGTLAKADSLDAPASLADTAPSDTVDPTQLWGAEASFGRASFWLLMTNFTTWVANEFTEGKHITQTSPRSWVKNAGKGFVWDDNTFRTNFVLHPYQGSLFHAAFRDHGYSYWQSMAAAVAGSLMWECCGESHLMSVNDFINTVLGGAAFGEMIYRTTGWILQNEAEGFDRFTRELTAGLISPVRGMDRVVSGRAFRPCRWNESPTGLDPDSCKPKEATPTQGAFRGALGVRIDGGSRPRPGPGPSIELGWEWGSYGQKVEKPFDHFSIMLGLAPSTEDLFEQLRIEGTLKQSAVPANSQSSALVLFQRLEFLENAAVEWGSQSLGLAWVANTRLYPAIEALTPRSNWWSTRVGISLSPIGGVRSEYASLAPVRGAVERTREYDFGAGTGVFADATFIESDDEGGDRWLARLSYQYDWLWVLHGSNWGDRPAWHQIQQLGLRWRPLQFGNGGSWGVETEASFFWRDSRYTNEIVLAEHGSSQIETFNSRFRIVLSWNGQLSPVSWPGEITR